MPDGAARDVLFDVAVNRAADYVARLDSFGRVTDATEMVRLLEGWALRTRFASRFDVRDIARIVLTRPDEGARWEGGFAGQWRASRHA